MTHATAKRNHAPAPRRALLPLLALALMVCAFAPIARGGAQPGIGRAEVVGAGAHTLILIPGLGCDASVWREFMERNKDRYTMHALTLAGFGGTEPPPDPGHDRGTPWLDGAVEAIGVYIETQGLDQPILIGHSMGGHLAMRFAAQRPGVLGAAVSVDGLPARPLGAPMSLAQREAFVNQNIAPQFRAMPDDAWREQQRGWIAGMVQDERRGAELADHFLATPRETTTRYLLELFRADITPELKGIDAPTYILGAIPDAGVPGGAENAEMMRSVWTQIDRDSDRVAVLLLENCRHFVMDDKPDRLDAIVRAVAARDDVRQLGDNAGADAP